MYEIAKTVINSGNFELESMLHKINTLWLQESLTEDQRNELVALAREKALPENSYAGIHNLIAAIFKNLAEMSVQITANTNAIKELKGEEVTPEETEDYPEYVQPTGAHDAYNTGDKVTYNGKKYTCLMDGCVWNPDIYPQGWEAEE